MAQSVTADRRARGIHILLLVVLSVAAYANSFTCEFVIDDYARWGDADGHQGQPFGSQMRTLFTPQRGAFYRPIPYASHVIDYRIWGPTPLGFHITNIVLHMIVVILVYLLALTVFKSAFAALSAGLLFAAHPVHTEAVTYIAGRTDVVMGLFFLVSLLLYIKFRLAGGRRSYLLYTGSVVCFILALMSKEAAIALPLILLAYEVYFHPGREGERRWGRLVFPLAPSVAVGLVYLGAVLLGGMGKTLTLNKVGLWRQALTAVRAFHRYLYLLFSSTRLSFVPELNWSESFSRPGTLVPLLTLAVLVAVIFLTRRFNRIVSFGLAWIALSILPISNLFAVTDPPLMADRYLYVPSVGFSLVVAAVIGWAVTVPQQVPRARFYRRVGLVSLVVILAVYSFLSLRRNMVWQSRYTLAAATVLDSPGSSRAHNDLGGLHLENDRYEDAMREFRKALELDPSNQRALINLGIVLSRTGRQAEAVERLNEAIALDPGSALAHHNLGHIYYRAGKLKEAISEYQEALAVEPYNAEVRSNLANAYLMRGMTDEAILEYEKALAVKPNLVGAYANLSQAYLRKGRLDDAVVACKRALALDPGSAKTHNSLGNIHMMQGNFHGAISEYEQAVTLDPDYGRAHGNLCNAYCRVGDYSLAAVHCDRALKLGVDIDHRVQQLLAPYR